MGILGLKQGTAYLESKSDPKWNISVECLVGGFTMPDELKLKLEDLKLKYGKPPLDLEYGYMKD